MPRARRAGRSDRGADGNVRRPRDESTPPIAPPFRKCCGGVSIPTMCSSRWSTRQWPRPSARASRGAERTRSSGLSGPSSASTATCAFCCGTTIRQPAPFRHVCRASFTRHGSGRSKTVGGPTSATTTAASMSAHTRSRAAPAKVRVPTPLIPRPPAARTKPRTERRAASRARLCCVRSFRSIPRHCRRASGCTADTISAAP